MTDVTHDDVEKVFDAIWHSDIAALTQMAENGFDIAAAERAKDDGAIEVAVGHPDDGEDPRPLIETLLSLGANINASPSRSTTALWTAVIQCRSDLVEWLIQHGANVNQILEEGELKETALDYAFTDQFLFAGKTGDHTVEEYQALIDLLRLHGAKTFTELSSNEA